MHNLLSFITKTFIFICFATLVTACGGGSSSAENTAVAPVTAASPVLSFVSVKTFHFSWTDVSDATFYKILENTDGNSGFTQAGDDISSGTQNADLVVTLYRRLNAQYILQSCNNSGCTDSATMSVNDSLAGSIGYLKASNPGDNDSFGAAVSLSGDGSTLAVGAWLEASSAVGINANQNNNDVRRGAVYIFTQSAGQWTQQAYLKSSTIGSFALAPAEEDRFGFSLSLNNDGNTLAVGAPLEASNAVGINGDETNESAAFSGAVYVFIRSGTSWSQQAYIKASNTDGFDPASAAPFTTDKFGSSVSVSSDGDTLAVGAPTEASNAVGINGNQTDNSANNAGAVYVFTRSAQQWSQQAYIKASNTAAGEQFGFSIDLSGDSNTLLVGAPSLTDPPTTGQAYVFIRTGSAWSEQTRLSPDSGLPHSGIPPAFGVSVSLSADGDTAAIGGFIGGTALNPAIGGIVFIYTRSSNSWSESTILNASNSDNDDYFGITLDLSDDGTVLAVTANEENSNAIGLNGNESDNNKTNAGAAYLFTQNAGSWNQTAYIKASNTDSEDHFGGYTLLDNGKAVSLSGDGLTLAVGAPLEDGDSPGIGGDAANNDVANSGAVYLY